MRRSRRQVLSLAALVVAALATLATSGSAPTVYDETTDVLSFRADQPTQIRRVRVDVASGDADAQVMAHVSIKAQDPDGKPLVVVSVVRDRDGNSIGDHSGRATPFDGSFVAIRDCPRDATCSESFTITFELVPEDGLSSLDLAWTLSASAHHLDLGTFASLPAGASISATITR
jgi:hypothetical protein